ncbi:hypothetical protein MBLNU457_5551t1 [Dothideomycetes sp. NU457]
MDPSREHPAQELLARAHSPDTAASIFRQRIKQRPLLLRPSSPDPKDDARAKRRKAREAKDLADRKNRKSRKPKPLSAKKKRSLCIYDIPKEQRKYQIYVPLHDMWCAYVREILGTSTQTDGDGKFRAHVSTTTAGPMLASADFHGAMIEVVRSRCVSRVGLKGIVLKDSKYTFELITEQNELKTIPKEHSLFRFQLPLPDSDDSTGKRALVFELHGSQFENRAPERANKKFKQHIDPDL